MDELEERYEGLINKSEQAPLDRLTEWENGLHGLRLFIQKEAADGVERAKEATRVFKAQLCDLRNVRTERDRMSAELGTMELRVKELEQQNKELDAKFQAAQRDLSEMEPVLTPQAEKLSKQVHDLESECIRLAQKIKLNEDQASELEGKVNEETTDGREAKRNRNTYLENVKDFKNDLTCKEEEKKKAMVELNRVRFCPECLKRKDSGDSTASKDSAYWSDITNPEEHG